MRMFLFIFACITQQQIFSQPLLTTFSPASGPVGTTVTITGGGFSINPNSNVVFFGAVRGTVTTASPTSLTVTVPAGASYQPISVTAGGLTTHSRKPFSVTFAGGGIISKNTFSVDKTITVSKLVTLGVKDVDNDGKADLVASSIGGEGVADFLSIYKNSSAGGILSFEPAIKKIKNGANRFLAFADLDGDGKPEIVAPNMEGSISIFKNSSTTGAISFSDVQNFPTAGGYGIAVGDLDGDGMTDIVSTNNSTFGVVSVYRNTSVGGIISFDPEANFATSRGPRGVSIGYIDADNKPDLVVAHQDGTNFGVFINTSSPGNISFNSRIEIPVSKGSPESVAIGDIDGDDKADVVVGTNNSGLGSVAVFRNTSFGSNVSFAPSIECTTGNDWHPFLVVLSDIDGDGRPDLAVTNQFNSGLSVFKNNSAAGNISFSPKVDFDNGAIPRNCLVLNDLNGDGKPELCGGGVYGIPVLRNNIGAPNLTSLSAYDGCIGTTISLVGNNFTGATDVSFGGIAAASFSVVSDLMITAVLGQGTTGDVSVTTPTGTTVLPGFTYTGQCVLPPTVTSFTPDNGPAGTSVLIHGENFSAVAVENTVYFGAVKAVITAATLTTLAVEVPAGATNKPITVTTKNLTAYTSKSFTLTFNSGADICDSFSPSSFRLSQDFGTGAGPYTAVISDANIDGKPDVIAVNFAANTISILKNLSFPGTNSFSPKTDLVTGVQPIAIAYGDLDGDEKQDIVVTNNFSNTVSIFRNASLGGVVSYGVKIDLSTAANPRGVYIHDLDQDGRPDIIVTSYEGNLFQVFRNTSGGSGIFTFAAPVSFQTGLGPTSLYVMDLDGDDNPDIAVVNSLSNTVSVFRNSSSEAGLIAFQSRIDYNTGNLPGALFIDDLNTDGKPDLIVSNSSSSTISVFKNLSDLNSILFSVKTDYPTGTGPSGIVVADLNGDGKPDISTANVFDGSISVFRNSGTAGALNFDGKVDYFVGNGPRGISAGDIDNDGKPDIITTNNGDNSISVLRNSFGSSVAGTLCADGNGRLESSLAGSSYQWQVNDGSGYTNLTDNNSYSGSTAAVLILNNLPTTWYGHQYRCVVDGNNSQAVTLTFKNRWLGTVDTAWENPANWSCNQIPDANTDVSIGCSHTVNISTNAICRKITADRGATVNIMAGYHLTITR